MVWFPGLHALSEELLRSESWTLRIGPGLRAQRHICCLEGTMEGWVGRRGLKRVLSGKQDPEWDTQVDSGRGSRAFEGAVPWGGCGLC